MKAEIVQRLQWFASDYRECLKTKPIGTVWRTLLLPVTALLVAISELLFQTAYIIAYGHLHRGMR
jgi:hypothetical protein